MNSISIYISSVKIGVTEKYVKDVFGDQGISGIERVDFTPIGKKPGFTENTKGAFKSAFVHFKVSNSYMLSISNFWKLVSEGNGYKFYPSYITTEYWLLFPAKKPIQQTMMNTSQIVENGRHLENLIAEQAKKIEEQESRIEKLVQMCEATQTVVYQLLGGLFNQESQNQILQDNLSILFSEERVRSRFEEPDDSVWKHWPTTRQGDHSERRIEALEQTVREMLNFDAPEAVFTPQEDDEEQDGELQARKFAPQPYTMPTDEELFEKDSVSEHSSMPELIDDNSISTHSSMPELEECSSEDSEERIRNSFELCGNE
jgi:hypothetical protein